MITALYSGATGMTGQQQKLDTISNNLANTDTTGFKRVRTEFVDLFYQYAQNAGVPVLAQTSSLPSGVYTGLGSRVAATSRIFTEGNIEETGSQLDIAISGDGFMQVLMQDGSTAYTRDGALKLDNDGTIVLNTGYQIIPAITVPAEAVSIQISSDGTVAAVNADDTLEVLGQIPLVRFVNPTGLDAMGNNLYRATPASGDPQEGIANQDGFGYFVQGYLEKSNVNAVREMVNMITSQRAYELNSRSIQTADDMLRTVYGLKRS
jgi:flagellar basal-body rod protein FlgG